MICPDCKEAGTVSRAPIEGNAEADRALAEQLHAKCPEAWRQKNPKLSATELKGSPWCDCAHNVPVRGKYLAPTLKQ